MFNRLLVSAAALVVFAAAPVFANGAHTDKGASRQGLSTDANFNAPTTVNGIAVTPFFNNNDSVNPLLDIFQLPSSFTTGSTITLTFANINAGYGSFDCDNGSSSTAISVPETGFPDGKTLTGPCTKGALGSNDAFINFTEVGNVATLTFNGGTGNTPPPAFYFWTPDANLLSMTASGGGSVPEPSTYAMLALGLIGIAFLRRRAVQA
jgi:hypothetical protein